MWYCKEGAWHARGNEHVKADAKLGRSQAILPYKRVTVCLLQQMNNILSCCGDITNDNGLE